MQSSILCTNPKIEPATLSEQMYSTYHLNLRGKHSNKGKPNKPVYLMSIIYRDEKCTILENRKLLRSAWIILMWIWGKIECATPLQNHKDLLTRMPMDRCTSTRSKCLKPYLNLPTIPHSSTLQISKYRIPKITRILLIEKTLIQSKY